MTGSLVLETVGLTKSFPGVHALRDVGLRLFAGEIHTLMGQNGAGKSTLINVLTGVHTHDAGEILIDGKPVSFAAPLEAEAAGIRTLYQEVNLCPNLSVAENIFAGRQPRRRGAIDWKAIRKGAESALAELNVSLDVTKSLDTYSIAVQQMVAIARAVSVEARVLILDEPTSSLDDSEVARLFDVLRKLKRSGMAILFVTHFLEQTYAVSDRITVMRNGEREGEYLAKDLPVDTLVEKMVGDARMAQRQAGADDARNVQAAVEPGAEGAARFRMQGVGRRGLLYPVDLSIEPGSIVGLAGLLGSGRTETAQLLFGAQRADTGSITVDGKPVKLGSPRHAVRHGIGYCPEDRKKEGIVAALSIRENIVLALQARRGWWRPLGRARERRIANEYIKALGIRARDAEQPIELLSGGNQQKALLARWLAIEPRMLILDEPTRGIDVAAKFDIMDRVLALCAKGLGILLISSELGEVLRVSHRVAVLRDRRKVAELAGDGLDEDQVYRLIAGGQAS
ncbi:sugar ABC transporter ATP-binding protein [Trinickia caryophylli]|uniref:Monosaccharide ABC transporter ATP-binding protein, CUT2 family n=1 Tax=Trinickia caryophylli TaxID=28094 RepID=A0A1X7D1N2_TRICW|nr:sugar ABC transporter ATP-binding protein [Trinickia caryophylli]PMS13576.1 sugar ABC transporter ATP-binding protein [Trinickia caryophylli]TRX15256.1 sugar ABC transporter ATP-binding protein [Trinickia caryophylli]WQE15131.1 sugar ABC transporter ATP-binding protein [Trinickia caryophylli]SMF06871.1 monosaccharide ABC transporter ATP-binding protein, CUT2 family [Trinickia caryophylli]GLU31132.1 ABC transporter ATP-binding protein [Trinickia caryophylli]